MWEWSEHLKLGKSSAFVKRDLRLLPMAGLVQALSEVAPARPRRRAQRGPLPGQHQPVLEAGVQLGVCREVEGEAEVKMTGTTWFTAAVHNTQHDDGLWQKPTALPHRRGSPK
jgi:hypothetical protein